VVVHQNPTTIHKLNPARPAQISNLSHTHDGHPMYFVATTTSSNFTVLTTVGSVGS
jgi:hypothetical protein